jgi:putative DNA primase/helicase
VTKTKSPPWFQMRDDIGNGRRLVEMFGAKLRYVPEWRIWIVWGGARWVRDCDGVIVEAFAKRTARAIFTEAAKAAKAGMSEDAEKLSKWAVLSANDSRIRAMVRSARSEPEILVSADLLDADPWVLGCENGTIDLRTGQLRAATPEDLITKSTGIKWDPKATCPAWEQHIGKLFPEEDTEEDTRTREVFHKHIGAALVGDAKNKPEVFLYLQGASGAGKGAATHTLAYVLGDYAAEFDAADFVETGFSRHKQWMTRFNGARLAIVDEVRSGAIDVALLKKLSGGDSVTANEMRRADQSWRPTHTLVFTANVGPNFNGDTNGIQRRYVPLPVGSRQDPEPGYEDRLKAEAEGILAWCVRGTLWWLKETGETGADGRIHGGEIELPRHLAEVRDAHVLEHDPFGAFIFDCIMHVGGAWLTRSDAHTAYVEHARTLGDSTPSFWKPTDPGWSKLHDKLDQAGRAGKSGGVRGWYNIDLKSVYVTAQGK